MNLQDFQVGDMVMLDCPKLFHNTKSINPITGIIIQVFDKLFKDGSEGNLEIDISYSSGKWIRYIPLIDEGVITLLKRNK